MLKEHVNSRRKNHKSMKIAATSPKKNHAYHLLICASSEANFCAVVATIFGLHYKANDIWIICLCQLSYSFCNKEVTN